jgi:hypothetical protein
MDFFRKYQRVILYTAGIFALVSFSISAPILGFFDSVFRKQVPMPVLRIGDRIVSVTQEDVQVATQVALLQRFLPPLVMPDFVAEDADNDRREIYAAVRRLAIHYGLEISEDEVERAVQQTLAIAPAAANEIELARLSRSTSVGEFRRGIGEALRMGTFVRLQALAADVSDASLIEQLIEDAEQITLEVAILDEEKLQAEIEATDVTDEDLQKWVGELEPFDQRARGYVGDPLHRVQIAHLDLATFDPSAYAAELGELEFSDDEVDNFYVLNRAALYLKPADEKDGEPKDGEPKDGEPKDGDQPEADAQDADQDPYLPLDDALKAEIRKRLAAEAVLRKLWTQVREQFDAFVKEAADAVEAAQLAVEEQQAARDEAAVRGAAADATEAEKAALAAADLALEQAKAAVTTAEDALEARRLEFDLRASYESAAAGRPGAGVLDSGDELLTAAAIGELAPITGWPGPVTVTEEQPLSTQVLRAKSAAFGLRWLAAEPAPLKPFADIREKARADYFKMRSEELAEERAEAFEKSVEELAKARVADRIAELEQERDRKIGERFEAWRTGLEADLAKAREELAAVDAGDPLRRVYVSAKNRVDRLETDLAGADAKREAFRVEEQAAIDAKIGELAKENYAAVLVEAAGQHGFSVETFGPLPRDLSSRGTPREAFPKPVAYLMWSGNTSDLQKGEATDLLVDFTGRARYLAAVTDEQPGTLAEISRRQLLQARRMDAPMRRVVAARQSFTLDALRQRFGWQAPAEAVVEPTR